MNDQQRDGQNVTAAARRVSTIIKTMAVAFFGGAICNHLGLPAGWLAGAMIAVTVYASLCGKTLVPDGVRVPVFLVLGISIGSSLTPDTIANAARWPVSLIALGLCVVLIAASTFIYFRRVAGWSRSTAFFAALPGALSLTLMLAESTRADLGRVALAQSVRLFCLVVLLPVIVSFGGETKLVDVSAADQAGPWSLSVSLGVSLLAAFVFHKAGLPGATLVGPMLAVGGLHLAGITSGTIPDAILVPCYVVMGAMIASRFNALSRTSVRRDAGSGLIGFAIGASVATISALAVAGAFALPFGPLLLAFAPGGLEAMVIIAFVLDLDPAFVGTHQLMRFVGISFLVPLIIARFSD